MHDEDQAGYKAFKQVAARLAERDPRSEYARYRICGEITQHARMLEMTDIAIASAAAILYLPVQVSELALRIEGTNVAGMSVDGVPLRKAGVQADFQMRTFWVADGGARAAFDPQAIRMSVEVHRIRRMGWQARDAKAVAAR